MSEPLYDFEKYYQPMTVDAAVKLDRGGLPIKTLASTEDEEGEVALNERVTNNVKYYISYIEVLDSSGKTVDTLYSPKYSGVTLNSVRVVEAHIAYENDEEATVYIGAGYGIEELEEYGIIESPETSYKRLPDTIESGDHLCGDEDGTVTFSLKRYDIDSLKAVTVNDKVGSIRITYIPRYEIMDYNDEQSQNFGAFGKQGDFYNLKVSLEVLGFGRDREKSWKWLNKAGKKDTRAVVGYDSFRKSIRYMSEYLNDGGMGLEINYYDDNYVMPRGENVPEDPPTREEWRKNHDEAQRRFNAYKTYMDNRDYTRTDMKYKTKYGALPELLPPWIEKVNRDYRSASGTDNDLVADISGLEADGGTGTALIPNVADAFKAFYYPKEELAEQFEDDVSEIIGYIRKTPLSKFISKIGSDSKLLNEMITQRSEAVFKADNVGKFAIELEECKRFLYREALDSTTMSTFGYKTNAVTPRARAFSISGFGTYVTQYTSQVDGKRTITVTHGNICNSSGECTIGQGGWDGWKKYVANGCYGPMESPGRAAEYYKSTTVGIGMKSSNVLKTLRNYYASWYKSYHNISGRIDIDIYSADSLSDIYDFISDYRKHRAKIARITSATLNTLGYIYETDIYAGYMTVMVVDDKDRYYTYWHKNGEYRTVYLKSEGWNKYVEVDPDFKANVGGTEQVLKSEYTAAQYLNDCGILLNAIRTASQNSSDVSLYMNSLQPEGTNYKLTGQYYLMMLKHDITGLAKSTVPLDWEDYCTIEYTYRYTNELMMDQYNSGCIIENVVPAIKRLLATARYNMTLHPGDYDDDDFDTLDSAYDAYSDLSDVTDKIQYYQSLTRESVFSNKSLIESQILSLNLAEIPARFMVPVLMYKKVRVKRKVWGRTRHRMVKKSIGVRWVEVRVIDTTVYGSYPQLPDDACAIYDINKDGSVKDGGVLTFNKELEGDAASQLDLGTLTDQDFVTLVITSKGYTVEVEATTSDSRIFTFTNDGKKAYARSGLFPKKGNVRVTRIKTPLPGTPASDERTDIQVRYEMPAIPRMSEIRHRAFSDYGPFDQSQYALQNRSGDNLKGQYRQDGTFVPTLDKNGNVIPVVDRKDGWRIFRPSSSEIESLRTGIGVYDAAAMLLAVLKNEYGEGRVELCECMRSMEDEAMMCSGSAESEFLSWHNYGLAVKIMIYQDDMRTPIDQDGDDFRKLIDIAEAFTNCARNAKVCPKPLNVVWCGRLVMGANIFVWEFLPIGVNHKDAPLFREAVCEQRDAVAELGYVDAEPYAVVKKPGNSKKPYILKSSAAYKTAEMVGTHHYVSPSSITNYSLPGKLPLINVIEFIRMIRLKQNANGTTLTDRANIYEWKALNEESYKQLVTYFGMIGNFSGAQALVAGDYVETYQSVVDTLYENDFVAFVKSMLGNLYERAKIFISSVGDGAAYISLADGRIHVFANDMRSPYSQEYKKNFFGQQQADPNSMVYGVTRDGIFYTLDEAKAAGLISEYVSDDPVLEGYKLANDGTVTVTGSDAMYLHSMVAAQIKDYYDRMKDMFENYGGELMYDHFIDGPNADMVNMLENEFGVISAQDLMSFDSLREMLNRNTINFGSGKGGSGRVNAGINEEDGGYGNLDANGNPYDSIFEKVVSNAQLAGVRKASLTKEHIVEVPRAGGLTTERLYELLTKGKKITANDIMRR